MANGFELVRGETEAVRASDPGAGEGQGSRSGCWGVLGVFLLAVGLGVGRAGVCGAALPSCAADPFLNPGE